MFRVFDADGRLYADLIGLAGETASLVARQFNPIPSGVATLLSLQFSGRRRLMPRPEAAESRERFLYTLERLD